MRFVLAQLSRLAKFLLGLGGELIHSMLRAMGDALMTGARRLGRLLGRLALIIAAIVIVGWLAQNEPQVLGQMIMIGVLIAVLWYMIKSPFKKWWK